MLTLQPQSVLIVDDAATWRKLLSGLLQQWGYDVYEAENGEQALAMLARHPINLLLSDWEMPVMDGLTLCRQVRQRFQQRYIYLILLTVRESTDDLRAGFEAGADDFLRKPVNRVELQARLHAGERILQLEQTLARRNHSLSEALQQIQLDLQAAAALQQSILPPHAMRHGDYFADWLFIPSAWVSGDIFNVFPLDKQAIGFYSVDVSGHGVSAAMMSVAVARQFLHGRTVERFLYDGDAITPPARVVQILNDRFMAQSSDVTSYFTMVYGVIDRHSGAGRLCQAGHPTPLIVSPDGSLREIAEGGPPVGLLDTLTWEEVSFTLAPGERLCLYSDGISECENPQQEMLGASRFAALLAEHARLPLAQQLAQIHARLNLWRQSPDTSDSAAGDDISLLMIERQPLSEQEQMNEN